MANVSLMSQKFRQDVMSKLSLYRKHPIMAGKELLECDFPPAQRVVLRQLFDLSFLFTSATRGFGKSFLAAVQGLLTAILMPNSRILFTGPTFRTAKIIFMEMEKILNNSKRAQIWLKRPPIHNSDMWRCEFITGSIIFALPLASESEVSIRGVRAHLILADEVPHIPEDTFSMVLTPMISTRKDPMIAVRKIEQLKRMVAQGKITKEEALSKDFGFNKLFCYTSAYFKFNHAYKKMEEFQVMRQEKLNLNIKPNSDTFCFSYLDLPEGFPDLNAVEMAKRTMADFQFRMEWLSEWQNDSNGFYTGRLVDSCIGQRELRYFPEVRGDRTSDYYMGIDPARTEDNFAIAVGKDDKGIFKLVKMVTFRNKRMDREILQEVRQLLRDFPNMRRVSMDLRGGGLHFKDLLNSRTFLSGAEDPILDMDDEETRFTKGKRILRMVNMNPQWATDYNFAMKATMERGGVLFPGTAPEGSLYIKAEENPIDIREMMMVEITKTIKEIKSVQISQTGGGHLKFDGPSKRSETDRYVSTLLAFSGFKDCVVREAQNVRVELPSGDWAENLNDVYDRTMDDSVDGFALSEGEMILGG